MTDETNQPTLDQPRSERFAVRPRKEYTAADLEHLSDLVHVRKRPSMYVGDRREGGLHCMADVVLDLAIGEVLSGLAERIEVTINSDGSLTVEDDGRGVPVDWVEGERDKRVTLLERVMTSLSFRTSEPRFREQRYVISGGLHGAGIPIVNYLSRECIIETRWEGRHYRQCYFRGTPKGPVEDLGPSSGSGVRFTFLPDDEIFGTARFNSGRLIARLEELSFLLRGTRIGFEDRRKHDFFSRAGIPGYISHLNQAWTGVHDVIHAKGEREGVRYEAAFQYRSEFLGRDPIIHVYVNTVSAHERGTPWDGFLRALTDTLLEFGAKRFSVDSLPQENFTKGLTAIVSISLEQPKWFGSTKAKVGNPEAETAVYEGMADHLRSQWMQLPEAAAAILEHLRQT